MQPIVELIGSLQTLPEEFVLREPGETEEYAMHAGHQWRKIKGALEHMKETVERSVPKTLRQELKSYI
jgi:hypothetical protein